jgi:hypothetical protein
MPRDPGPAGRHEPAARPDGLRRRRRCAGPGDGAAIRGGTHARTRTRTRTPARTYAFTRTPATSHDRGHAGHLQHRRLSRAGDGTRQQPSGRRRQLWHARQLSASAGAGLERALTQAALVHSDDMVANNFFSHTGSDGSSAGQRATAAGYAWRPGARTSPPASPAWTA